MKQSIPLLDFGGGGLLKPLILLSLLLVLATERISAQTAFMTEYQAGQISMTTAQTTRFNGLQSDGQNQSVKIVATADVRSKQVNGKLSFVLPGLADSLHVEATLIRDDASGFVWSGKILNQPGYVSFLKLNGLTSGFIQVDTHFYELMPMGTSYQFLVERVTNGTKTCGNSDGVSADTIKLQEPGPEDKCAYYQGENPNNRCPALIYMLLVITPAAKTYILNTYGDINAFVLQGQNQINLAFSNSDIPNKEVSIKWIEKDLTQANLSLSNPPDIGEDQFNLPDLLEPERTDYNADVAMLLTHQQYTNAGGVVYDFGPAKGVAYALVEAPYFSNNLYAATHELGHLLGCHHNWKINLGDDDEVLCAHAYRWIEDVGPTIIPGQTYLVDSWRTLLGIPMDVAPLAYPVVGPAGENYFIKVPASGNTVILHFSNPDVSYAGAATGKAAGYIANNARQIRNAACEVADFYPTQDLSVFITTSSCSTVPFTFTADITEPSAGLPGQGPYTVTWFWNTSGNFNTSFSGNETSLGSGQVLTINEHPNCRVYWVKCKVVAADQTTVVRFKKVDLTPLHCYCVPPAPGGGGTGGKLSSTSERDNQALKFFPNPVTGGEISFEHPDLSSSNAKATISDVSGRTMLQTQIFTNAAGQSSIILEHALPSGLYFLHLQTVDGLTWDNKFTVLKN